MTANVNDTGDWVVDWEFPYCSGLLEALENLFIYTNMTFDEITFASLPEAANHEVDPRHQIPAINMPRFMDFPVEIRARIINEYLNGEACDDWWGKPVRRDGIGKPFHHDWFGSPCCVWNWPTELIVCDKPSDQELPHPVFPRWFPNLALTNHQVRGEMVVHMLKTTDQFTLKFNVHNPSKISRWMSRFLASFPSKQGTDAVKDLNFPHIHRYGSFGPTLALTNPDVDLMLQCRNLSRVRLTFHTFRINQNPNECNAELPQGNVPLTINQFLDRFKLRPMVNHDNLKEVWLGGILYANYVTEGGDQLKTLRLFAQWMHEEFAKKQPPQEVRVILYPRQGRFNGWHDGEEV